MRRARCDDSPPDRGLASRTAPHTEAELEAACEGELRRELAERCPLMIESRTRPILQMTYHRVSVRVFTDGRDEKRGGSPSRGFRRTSLAPRVRRRAGRCRPREDGSFRCGMRPLAAARPTSASLVKHRFEQRSERVHVARDDPEGPEARFDAGAGRHGGEEIDADELTASSHFADSRPPLGPPRRIVAVPGVLVRLFAPWPTRRPAVRPPLPGALGETARPRTRLLRSRRRYRRRARAPTKAG
jgi:hypothetical protein